MLNGHQRRFDSFERPGKKYYSRCLLRWGCDLVTGLCEAVLSSLFKARYRASNYCYGHCNHVVTFSLSFPFNGELSPQISLIDSCD